MPINNIQLIRDLLNRWNNRILSEIPSPFTAFDYLKRFRELNYRGYNFCLDNAGGAEVFNSWFARWFLIGLEKDGRISRTGRRSRITSVHGRPSRNVEWVRN